VGAMNVVFESQHGDHWEPVQCSALQVGDVVRMRDTQGNIIGEASRVSRIGGTDPDSSQRADFFLDPIGDR
jgi:hypothetical protein